MCEHGGLDGNCLRCKDATIARLEAENAALREEAALYQKEWAILRAEVEQLKKELRILYSSNTDIFARAEQAENAVKILADSTKSLLSRAEQAEAKVEKVKVAFDKFCRREIDASQVVMAIEQILK
jgi:chromosome segregation ATPase